MSNSKEWLISALIIVSVVLIFVQIIYSPTGLVLGILYAFDLAVVIILAVDFYKRVKKSSNPKKYVLTHIYEIPAMIPLMLFGILEASPITHVWLRSLRLLRLFRLIHLVSRTTTMIGYTNSRLLYIVVFSIASVTLGALCIFILENNIRDTKINTFGDAFWWAIVTVTTVGYGDVYPITIEGKIIASILMFIGIAVIGLFVSTLGASLIDSRIKKDEGNKNEDKYKGQGDENSDDKNQEIRLLIKEKIDNIEKLNKEDISILVSLINTLYANSTKNKMDVKQHKNFKCNNCTHENPQQALFCNMCGKYIKIK